MGLVAMTLAHLFLAILLVPLLGLDGARGPCPTSCRCTLDILNCSRISSPPGFLQVPQPMRAAHPQPYIYLDFSGNAISATGKEEWEAFPWAESLVLKDNGLRRLRKTSLEGLLSLTDLDLSGNLIQRIDTGVFEAVPFLQVINLHGNVIERLSNGTFRAWHGLQFLRKVDLSHNPLVAIQDSYLYSLPSLKILELGATEVILEDLLQTSLKERHFRRVMRYRTNPRRKTTLLRVRRDGRKFAMAAMQSTGQTGLSESNNEADSQQKRLEGLELAFLRPRQAGLQPSQKRSVSGSLANTHQLAGSIAGGQKENNVTGVSGDGTSEVLQDDYFPQRNNFEEDLNKHLNGLIPNPPVRKLMSHVIRILDMDCTAPAFQVACAKLISRTGLLMRTFKQQEKERSSFQKSFSSASRNVPYPSSQKLKTPLDGKANQGIPKHKYTKKLMVAILLTAMVTNIVAVICLIAMCSQRWAAKDGTFWGRGKKPLPDEELPNTASSLRKKPPPPSVTQPLDGEQKSLADQLRYEGEIPRWGNERPFLPEPPENQISSDPSSTPTLEVLFTALLLTSPPTAPPSPPHPPSAVHAQKPSVQTDTDTVRRTSEATSRKQPSSTEEQGEEEKEEDSS